MLPRKYRLPLKTELKRVKSTGRLIHGRLFSLLITPQIRDSHAKGRAGKFEILNSRFAFIISSKVHKRAVKRNRAKRLLSEAIYSLIPKIKPGFDAVFLAKKAIIGKELAEIEKEVAEVFKKGNLMV